MSVSKKDVEYLAYLVRISFSDKEKENLIRDLNNLISYVEKLNKLDTKNIDIVVNPIYIENKFREDEIIKNSPQNLEKYILVPKVIE